MHTRIRNWSARRSGPVVTVKGDVEGGSVDGKVGVVLIEARQNGRVMATDRDGQEVELVTRASEDLTAIVREMIYGEGTDACLQRVIDLCNEAKERHGIERA